MEEEYTGRVAAAVIQHSNRDEYLVAKRADTGDWEFPGGKQHIDETILETAEREIKEEMELDIDALEASEKDSYSAGGYEIVPVYSRSLEERPEEEIRLHDHTDYEWIKPETEEIELGKEKRCLEAFDLI